MRLFNRGTPRRLDADVVIVGSGSGGGAAAARLAEHGLRVILLEEGAHVRGEQFGTSFVNAAQHLYRDLGATVLHGPPNILFQEGKCVGGSTVVNGGMAWRAPESVLTRWQRERGIDWMQPDEMAPYFEYVEQSIHVAEQPRSSMSAAEQLFGAAAAGLGMHVTPNRRAQKECHGSGICILGCPDDRKQSVLVTYIPRAVAAGAELIPNCRAERLVLRGGRAAGVLATITDSLTGITEQIEVRAERVLLAGGALQTPALLQASGVGRASRGIGRNLCCHPNAKVVGVYDRDIGAWQGVHQGSQIHDFLDDGILLACAGLPPAAIAPGINAVGDEHWARMREYNRMLVTAVLVDDSTTGRVDRLPGGMLVPRYRLDDLAAQRIRRGVDLLARIHFAAGARAVQTPFAALPMLHSIDDLPRLAALDVDPKTIEVVTVHAMGTCAMGNDPRRDVVQPSGESWAIPGLWIADASVLPSSVGLNPMVTIQAVATRIADQLFEASRPALPSRTSRESGAARR